MNDLADVHRHFRDIEMFEHGVVTYRAVNDPKELKKMEPQRVAAEIDPNDLPGMLRIPKKRPAESNGG